MQAYPQFRNTVASWTRLVLDTMYPRTCVACDSLLSGHPSSDQMAHWYCMSCEVLLPKIEPPFCEVCGEPFDAAPGRAFQCTNCVNLRIAFDFAIASYRTEDPVLDLIHRFKYGRDLVLRAPLALMLEQALLDPRLAALDLKEWRLVPVPLHRLRERDREFNQCRELCHYLSRRTAIPTVDAMQRTRFTENQAQLTRRQRLENLRGAFAMKRTYSLPDSPLRGARVLLVDDVFTTGATTNECARILKREGGVEKVVVISVARG